MIPINEWSRPGRKISSVRGVVIHWPAAAMWSAQKVCDYFSFVSPKEKRYASAHYAVGLSGEVVAMIPEDEVAYHVGSEQPDPKSGKIYTDAAREIFGKYARDPAARSPNACTIGIEVCHLDYDGKMSQATVVAAASLAADLCVRYNLDPKKAVMRHFDVVGWKDCPRYMVQHPDAWEAFLLAVESMVNKIKEAK